MKLSWLGIFILSVQVLHFSSTSPIQAPETPTINVAPEISHGDLPTDPAAVQESPPAKTDSAASEEVPAKNEDSSGGTVAPAPTDQSVDSTKEDTKIAEGEEEKETEPSKEITEGEEEKETKSNKDIIEGEEEKETEPSKDITIDDELTDEENVDKSFEDMEETNKKSSEEGIEDEDKITDIAPEEEEDHPTNRRYYEDPEDYLEPEGPFNRRRHPTDDEDFAVPDQDTYDDQLEDEDIQTRFHYNRRPNRPVVFRKPYPQFSQPPPRRRRPVYKPVYSAEPIPSRNYPPAQRFHPVLKPTKRLPPKPAYPHYTSAPIQFEAPQRKAPSSGGGAQKHETQISNDSHKTTKTNTTRKKASTKKTSTGFVKEELSESKSSHEDNHSSFKTHSLINEPTRNNLLAPAPAAPEASSTNLNFEPSIQNPIGFASKESSAEAMVKTKNSDNLVFAEVPTDFLAIKNPDVKSSESSLIKHDAPESAVEVTPSNIEILKSGAISTPAQAEDASSSPVAEALKPGKEDLNFNLRIMFDDVKKDCDKKSVVVHEPSTVKNESVLNLMG